MTELSSDPVVDATPAKTEYTPSDLGNLFAEARQQKPDDAPDQAAPEVELAEQADAAPAETQPSGETTETTEPADVPPIEPPRSWTKDRKEQFNALPRDLQEYVADRVQEQDREFRRSQNDVAEKSKAIEARLLEAEKVRQQYEAQLPALMQELQNAQQNSFADIKSMEDVERMQNEDPFRWQKWTVQQMKLQAVNAELERSKGEKARVEQAEWANFVHKQNELALEYIPELADKTKAEPLTKRVGERMKELGFKQDELNGFLKGDKISPFDYRFQRLLVNDLKLADIQKAPKAVAQKPVPPVQRPGTSKPPGSAMSDTIQNLSAKLERSGETRDLGALIGAMRRA